MIAMTVCRISGTTVTQRDAEFGEAACIWIINSEQLDREILPLRDIP